MLDTQNLIELLWTKEVFSEALASLLTRLPEKSGSLRSMFVGYEKHFAGTEITNYQHLLGTLNLPDPDDEHVLAAATVGKADFLLTYNLKDFPPNLNQSSKPLVVHPDIFLSELLGSNPNATSLFVDWLSLFKQPIRDCEGGAEALEKIGCHSTASLLRESSSAIDSQLRIRGER